MATKTITQERYDKLIYYEEQYKATKPLLSNFIKLFNDRSMIEMHLDELNAQERGDRIAFVKTLKKDEDDLAKKLNKVSDILQKI